MIYQNWIQKNPLIPWRFRHGFEKWLETSGWRNYPKIYRLIHFGRTSGVARQITTGPKHHFFGYYDKSPWNASENLLLAHEADFNDRAPDVEDSVAIGAVNLEDDSRFVALARSHAWNWQQGAMLQWHPANAERWFVYNDRKNGQLASVVMDTDGNEVETYSRPIYAITPDGQSAYSLNFARLQTHRPGYGYAGCVDPWAESLHPEQDGIYRMNLDSRDAELIISLNQLANTQTRPDMREVYHWVNHIQISPNGRRIAFFHIWQVGEAGWRVRLYTANLDGSDLNCLLDTDFISHYDWLDDEQILVWAKHAETRGNFLLCSNKDNSSETIGNGVLIEDGHCSFSPDRQLVLNDTYPDVYGLRTLMLYRWRDGVRIDLARLYSPKERWWGEIRCDLHPRWNRSGDKICVDSVHSGERQMYLFDVPAGAVN